MLKTQKMRNCPAEVAYVTIAKHALRTDKPKNVKAITCMWH
jgi:hypothetical protein